MNLCRKWLAFLALLVAGSSGVAMGQIAGKAVPGTEGVGLENHIGTKLPLDLSFTNEAGETVRLGDYFADGRPVVLNLVYYDCPMLCNLILDGFTRGLKEIPQTPGVDFAIVTVSFDPSETTEQAARQKARHIQSLDRPEAAGGWHFLTGGGENALRLADAVGFNYRWDETSGQYAHPAALMFVQPDGTLSRYLTGVTFAPTDLRAALADASEGRTGTLLDQFIMMCFQYNAAEHRYTLMASRLMMLGGALTLGVLGLFLTVLWRRHHSVSPLSA